MALTKITANVIEAGAISTASIADTSITADKLAATLDLTGKAITVATASAGDNDTTVASTAFVTTAIANLTDSAPAALDTLNELAAALNDDANFSTTVTNSIATKLPLAGGTLTGDLNFGDNDKSIFGAGSDLQIYHDGSNSYIRETGTGDLYIQGTQLRLQSSTGESFFVGVADGASYVYHNGSAKLNTTATGIDVTGTATMDGLTVDGTFASPLGIFNSTSGYARIALQENGVARMYMQSLNGADGFKFMDGDGTTERLRIDSSGNVGIGANSPSSYSFNTGVDLVVGDGNNNAISIVSSTSGLGYLAFADGTTGTERYQGLVEYSHASNYMAFRTAASEAMRIDSSGNIGIGQSSPNNETNRVSLELNDTWGGVFQNSVSGTPKSEWRWSTSGITTFGTVVSEPLTFTTNNTERLRIDSSGNVGINATPKAWGSNWRSLTINSTARTSIADTSGSATFNYNIYNDGTNNRYIDSTGAGRYRINGNTHSWDIFASGTAGDVATFTTPMTINGSGNVGIGTSSPAVKLAVSNNGAEGIELVPSGGGEPIIQSYNRSGSAFTSLRVTASDLKFYAGSSPTERMRIDSSGNVGIGITSPGAKLQVDGAIVSEGGSFSSAIETATDAGLIIQKGDYIYSDDNSYLRKIIGHAGDNNIEIGQGNTALIGDINLRPGTSGTIKFFSTGTEAVRIDSAGNVGIGTSSPNSKTHIVGSTNAIALRVTNTAIDGSNADVMHIEPSNGAYIGKLLRIQSGRSDFSDSLLFLNTTSGMNGTNGSYMRVQNNLGADLFRIKGDGKVGINRTSPNGLLHMQSSSGTDSALYIQTSATSDDSIINFGDNGGSAVGKILYEHSSDSMQFNTQSSERMRINSSGNVGIGTSSPSAKLHVATAGAEGINIGLQNSERYWNMETDGGLLQIKDVSAGGLARMTFDTSGRVGIGAAPQTAPYYNNDNPVLTVHKASGSAILPIVAAANTSSAILHLNQSGNRYWRMSAISGGSLTFGGKQPGSGAAESEAMRILSNGAIGMGFTSQISGGTLSVYSSADGGVVIGSSGGSNAFRKIYHNPANGILYFSSSGNAPYLSNAGSWVSASDIAIKKDIEDIDYGLETVKSLQPRRYKMKDTDEKQVGFVAQEIEQIVPEVVSGEDGKKGVSYGQITPLLVKAIQEQQTIIESLEARITALES